MRLRIKVY